MKHKKIVALIGIVSAVLLVAVGVFAVYWSGEPEIGYIHTDFAVNMDDPRILVGSKDYVFVCQVITVCNAVCVLLLGCKMLLFAS